MYDVYFPDAIFHNTVTMWVHPDDTNDENGALHVLAGRYKNKLNEPELKLTTKNRIGAISKIRSGGIQLMKPLLLHAPSKILNKRKGV